MTEFALMLGLYESWKGSRLSPIFPPPGLIRWLARHLPFSHCQSIKVMSCGYEWLSNSLPVKVTVSYPAKVTIKRSSFGLKALARISRLVNKESNWFSGKVFATLVLYMLWIWKIPLWPYVDLRQTHKYLPPFDIEIDVIASVFSAAKKVVIFKFNETSTYLGRTFAPYHQSCTEPRCGQRHKIS